MNKIFLSFIFVFIVHVKIPAGLSRTYENVKTVDVLDGGSIRLRLADDKIVYVPAMFTIIEEK